MSMKKFDSHIDACIYVSDEFSEEALNTVLLMVTRLESLSLNDLKKITVQFENLEGVKLKIHRDFTGTEFEVRPI